MSAAADEQSMRGWLYGGGTSVPCRNALLLLAVLASTVRFESLEILRLRLCGKAVISMPINDSHYAFIQRGNKLAAMASLPHTLAAIAVLRDGGHSAHYGSFEEIFILLSLTFSVCSLVSAALKNVVGFQQILIRCKSGGRSAAPSAYSDLGGSPSGRSSMTKRLTGSE